MTDKHGDIVDSICKAVGIDARRRPGSTTLDKKEAIQVLHYVQTLKEAQHAPK